MFVTVLLCIIVKHAALANVVQIIRLALRLTQCLMRMHKHICLSLMACYP